VIAEFLCFEAETPSILPRDSNNARKRWRLKC